MTLLCAFLFALLTGGTPDGTGYDTELTSENVEWIYSASDRGTHLAAYKEQVLDMVMQLPIERNHDCFLGNCGKRSNGKRWTPYLSTIRKLVEMGAALGYLRVSGSSPNERVRITQVAYDRMRHKEWIKSLQR